MTFVPYKSKLLQAYVGATTIRASPLVTHALQNDTTPRDGTLYLRSNTTTSFVDCGANVTMDPLIYNNLYMRTNLAELVADTSYNLTFLGDSELILPIVDCASSAIAYEDNSAVRVFYLMRKIHDPDDLYLLTWTLSTQDYTLKEEHQVGSAATITLTFLNDVRDTSVTYHHVMRLGFPFVELPYQPYALLGNDSASFWVLESIPRNNESEATRIVRTACRNGFYVGAETEQSNAKNLNWALHQDPIQAMTVWTWAGSSTIRDSWSWVHCIYFFFAFSAIFNLLVLIIVVYQNARRHKIWIGDAFVSVSSTLSLRALLVLFTWYVNGFWTLMEFCLKESAELAHVQHIFALPMIIHADLLTLYLGMAGLLGHLLHEIDPALAVFLFELGFHNRRAIALWFPATMDVENTFANFDFVRGLLFMEPKYTVLTPMRLWTMRELAPKDATFIAATLFPTFATFALVILYGLLRKLYRVYAPAPTIILSHASRATVVSRGSITGTSSITVQL